MKKILKKPGFEAVFYMGILLLIALPAMVFAQQDHRSLTINVVDGDTLVNGKKISELKPAERKEAEKVFAELGSDRSNRFFFSPRAKVMSAFRVDTNMKFKQMAPGTHVYNYRMFSKDSSMRPDSMRINGATVYSERRVDRSPRDHMPIIRPDMRNYRMPVMGDRASQNLDFVTIDKNGIPTRSNYRVTAVPMEVAKKLGVPSVSNLTIADIAFVPLFSSGETLLVFTLPAATPAEVTFTDSDGKTLWTAKNTGIKFTKTFALGLNGAYYLTVKQGGKTATRQVVKE